MTISGGDGGGLSLLTIYLLCLQNFHISFFFLQLLQRARLHAPNDSNPPAIAALNALTVSSYTLLAQVAFTGELRKLNMCECEGVCLCACMYVCACQKKCA